MVQNEALSGVGRCMREEVQFGLGRERWADPVKAPDQIGIQNGRSWRAESQNYVKRRYCIEVRICHYFHVQCSYHSMNQSTRIELLAKQQHHLSSSKHGPSFHQLHHRRILQPEIDHRLSSKQSTKKTTVSASCHIKKQSQQLVSSMDT